MSKAKQLRAQAAQHEADARESFERCDTDGFVSQWASGLNAQLDRRRADLAEHGDTWTFERVRLDTLDGEPVEDARVCRTRYGLRWRVDSADAWLPYMPARKSTLAKYGYQETVETETAPARAIHYSPSNARGLSGACSVQTIIIRTDRPKSENWRPVGAPDSH